MGWFDYNTTRVTGSERQSREHTRTVPIGCPVATAKAANSGYLRDPDVQLMLRVQQGDEQAFAELVTNYQDRLINVFSNLVDSRETAEDLAQEVFLRVYRYRDRYQPTARFSTWLFRVAHNVASNLRRTADRRREVRLNVRDSGPLGARPVEQCLPTSPARCPRVNSRGRNCKTWCAPPWPRSTSVSAWPCCCTSSNR